MRLRRVDALLLAIMLPVGAVALAFHLIEIAAGHPTVWPLPVRLAAAGDVERHPVVEWIFSDWAGGRALMPGDILLRAGTHDLAGISTPLALTVRVLDAAQQELPVPLVLRRRGTVMQLGLDVRRQHALEIAPVWAMLSAMVFSVTGLLLLLRAPRAPASRPLFVALVAAPIYFGSLFPGPPVQTYATLLIRALAVMVVAPCLLQAMLLLVPQTAPRTRVGLWWPWVFLLTGLFAFSSETLSIPFPPDVSRLWIDPLAWGFWAVSLLVVLTRSFLRADATGRRRIKWLLFGCYLLYVPRVLQSALELLGYRLALDVLPITVVGMVLPVCLLIAVARFNLLDIDRLLSVTASSTILGFITCAAVLVGFPRAAAFASDRLGLEPAAGQLVFALALAAVLVPAYRVLRPQIDRLFFRERYALERGVESLLGDLTTCDTPERLLEVSGDRLDALLRSEACVIYARAGDAYAPVFVRGRVVPAAFEAQGPLIAALRSRDRPLVAERWAGRRDTAALGPFDRAALETLGVAVVLPIRRGQELFGFLCLGGKRSGDVYTSTDVALLGSVAHAISRELLRFDDAEIIRQSSAMQAALRRYVPAPVAARVAGGDPLHAGECEVSVLFVDIRGYITYAEGRKSDSIFRTTNRFIQTVARILRERGGTVVEFTGDGLMAVFGAPEPLAQKERAAVEAARDLAAAVGAVEVEDAGPLSVGVGIATGPVWVGDVHAFDHAIWTVVGNTPNLAARLQALTRDLEAAVVIDTATWRGAGYVAADLVPREAVPIRGRSEPEDVYLLPLVALRATAVAG
jgi:class 3 adenylate cyclase